MQWLLVYICEAHADDEWPIGSSVCVKQHKSIEDRQKACQQCMQSLSVRLPTVLDDISNSFNDTYACWPLRFYLIDNGVLEVVAQPEEGAYDPLEIDRWIQSKLGCSLP